MDIKESFSLKKFNSFGIDVKADYFAEINSVEDLQKILNDPHLSSIPNLVLGGGSNILFTKDFKGLIIKNNISGIEVIGEDEDNIFLKAGAGVLWHDLVLFAIERNYAGIENLSLIPGTVGAAPIQNIGAYGVELKEVFESLEAVEINSGKIREFKNKDCNFAYRNSIFKNELKGKYVISSVVLSLKKKARINISYGAIKDTLSEMGIEADSIKNISQAVCKIRMSKLPNPEEIGNAGSFFKNPEIKQEVLFKLKEEYPDIVSYNVSPGIVKVPAGWLIERCGWKGKSFGEYGVHKNQALVLVNYGQANGNQIKELSEKIQASVKDKFGINLETEVNII